MQPCVQAFTRMVKVWKQGCEGQSWCMGYERRTAYYTAYRQVYRQDYETVHKCCPGWSQLNGEAGCLYPICSYGVCFNGGRCREGSSQLCDCPAGFHGPSCQYECSRPSGPACGRPPASKMSIRSFEVLKGNHVIKLGEKEKELTRHEGRLPVLSFNHVPLIVFSCGSPSNAVTE
ncbi:multiple epidermal growth factor-like domains protein 6 isoform X1, partial [Tachysurus ichikawai]